MHCPMLTRLGIVGITHDGGTGGGEEKKQLDVVYGPVGSE